MLDRWHAWRDRLSRAELEVKIDLLEHENARLHFLLAQEKAKNE